MKYANNMQLQVDANQGIARMTFVQVRAGINMPEMGVAQGPIVSDVVADVVVPLRMAQEVCNMLTKALNVPDPKPTRVD